MYKKFVLIDAVIWSRSSCSFKSVFYLAGLPRPDNGMDKIEQINKLGFTPKDEKRYY